MVVAKVSAARNPVREAENHFEAQAAQDALVEASGALKTVAVSLMRSRTTSAGLASAPGRGSGSLNPPPCSRGRRSCREGEPGDLRGGEMVSTEVIGNDETITVANSHSNLDLCTMMPVMAHDLQQSIEILANVARVFAHKCIDGITANEAVLRRKRR